MRHFALRRFCAPLWVASPFISVGPRHCLHCSSLLFATGNRWRPASSSYSSDLLAFRKQTRQAFGGIRRVARKKPDANKTVSQLGKSTPHDSSSNAARVLSDSLKQPTMEPGENGYGNGVFSKHGSHQSSDPVSQLQSPTNTAKAGETVSAVCASTLYVPTTSVGIAECEYRKKIEQCESTSSNVTNCFLPAYIEEDLDCPADGVLLSPPSAILNNDRMPSVSRVLNATMSTASRLALERWRQNEIQRLGVEGFERQQLRTLGTGRQLHQRISEHLMFEVSGGNVETVGLGVDHQMADECSNADAKELENFWRSVRPVLSLVSGDTQVGACRCRVEMPVHDGRLCYTGVVDAVAAFRQQPQLLEWKTVRRPRRSLADMYDAPVQTAAYLGAYNWTMRQATPAAPSDALPDGEQLAMATVIAINASGAPASVYVMRPHQCASYWQAWLRRLRQYWQQVDNTAEV